MRLKMNEQQQIIWWFYEKGVLSDLSTDEFLVLEKDKQTKIKTRKTNQKPMRLTLEIISLLPVFGL